MTTAAGHTPQAHFAAVDPVLAAIAAAAGPCPLGHSSRGSVFEALARSIAGQQLSGAVAARILERLIALHDGHFPTAAELAAADVATLRGVGFSFAKVAALHDLAAHTLDGRLAADAPLQAVALRFVDEASGATTVAPSYAGQDLLWHSVWRTLTCRGLLAVVSFGEPQAAAGRDRRGLARALRADIEMLRNH